MNPQAPRQHPSADAATDPLRSLLSALADGEAGPQGASQACAAFRDDPQARSCWHTYQLIGDVLRSEELASPPAKDAAFLASLRSRLAQEPVVLSPEPLPQPLAPALPAAAAAVPGMRRSPRWLAPAAVAAGFVAVAGVLVVSRLSGPDASGPAGAVLASGSATVAPGGGVSLAPAVAPNFTLATGPAVVPASPASAAMLRDAQLDLYLNAHQAARRSGAVALPERPCAAWRS